MIQDAPECSRAGCRTAARWNVNWRNPRIHSENRVKVWLACDEHRDFLHDYLSSRGFPVSVEQWSAPANITAEGLIAAKGITAAENTPGANR